jgi:hypothetical protein
MRRLALGLFLLIPTIAFAQDIRRENGDWSLVNGGGGCIGGSACKERRLRIPLEDRPVVAVRFRAHDAIGSKAEGALRVKIDGNTVESHLDIPRRGDVFTVEVEELSGRYLVFEPATDDEVEISEIAVLYGSRRGRIDRPGRGGGSGSGGGWRSYPRAAGCIGGDDCGRNGDRITIALDNAPVIGVRFYAHDAIGQRADGRLNVRIDDKSIASYVDVQRAGRLHEFDVDSISGTKLVIETASDDEVDIKDIEIMYGRRSSGGGHGNWGGGREITHEGGCIGGSQCGGKHARIRIAINGRAVNNIRFYARDDIGTKAGGELRIRIDDEILEYALDIPREGRNFNIDGKGIEGEYIFIEPAEDDEVDIKDVRVTFE